MVKTPKQHVASRTDHHKETMRQERMEKNPLPYIKRAKEMEAPKVTCLRLLPLMFKQRTEYFILSTTSFFSQTLYLHHHQLNAQVVRLVENARESARIMKDVAFRRLDGANETVRKGLVLMEFVKVAMMILK